MDLRGDEVGGGHYWVVLGVLGGFGGVFGYVWLVVLVFLGAVGVGLGFGCSLFRG
jgi:hypothetical protein